MSNIERNVLLVNPHPHLRKPGSVEPLGLLTLAAELQIAGICSVRILDGAIEEITPQKIEGFKYVAVTATTPQYHEAMKILGICQELSQKGQKIHTVIGGPHVSALPESSLNDGWDTVCVREGDLVAANIILEGQRGIIPGPQVTDLDSLPFPARELIDPLKYQKAQSSYHAITIMSTRGCPFACSFCDKTIMGRIVRFRSAESIAEEIKMVRSKWPQINYVVFYDDTFTINRNHTIEVCTALAPLGVRWECNSRVDTVDKQMLEEMKKAGCVAVKFGEESTNPEVLTSIGKGITTDQAVETIKMTQETGMSAHVYLMFGFPEDDRSSVDGMLELLDRANPNYAQLSLALPFPNTPLYQQVVELGYEVPTDWRTYYYAGPEGPHTYLNRTKFLDERQFPNAVKRLQEGFIAWAVNKGNIRATNVQAAR